MALLSGAVETQAHAHHAGSAQSGEVGIHQSIGGCRAQRHPQPALGGAGDDVEDIVAHHRVATGENQHGRCQLSNLVNECHGLLMSQFVRVGLRLGNSPTVPACQSTGSCNLPEEDERALCKVYRGEMRVSGHGDSVS